MWSAKDGAVVVERGFHASVSRVLAAIELSRKRQSIVTALLLPRYGRINAFGT